MIQEIFRMLNRSAVEIPTLPFNQCHSHPIPEGMLSRSIGMPSRREGPPSIWDTHSISGNVFVYPDASSSAPYPQELNPWSSRREEPIHSSIVEKSEKQTPVQDQRCQSGPSARNSVIPSEGDSLKNYGAKGGWLHDMFFVGEPLLPVIGRSRCHRLGGSGFVRGWSKIIGVRRAPQKKHEARHTQCRND